MMHDFARGLAPTLGFLLAAYPAIEAPAKPGDGQQAFPQATNPGQKAKHVLTTPYCGRHSTQPPWSMKFARLKRRGTHLKADYTVGAIGATIPLRATLTLDAKGGPVPEQMVQFLVDNKVVGEALTDRKGIAQVDYKVPNKMGPKSVTASFRGNQKCRGALDKTKVGTLRATTSLTWKNRTFANKGAKTHLLAKLTRTSDGAALKGREVAIYVDGKQVGTAVTNFRGDLDFEFVPTTGPGKLNVKGQFLGDPLYNPIAASDAIPLYPARQTAYIHYGQVTGMYGETVTAVVRINVGRLPLRSPLPNIPVRLLRERKLDPPHYPTREVATGTTNHYGIATASFTITDKPMRYIMRVKADIPIERYDGEHDTGHLRAYLNVLPATVELSVTGPSIVHIGESVTYQVSATRTTDRQRIENLTVCASSCASTDSSGRATIRYTVPSEGGTGTRQVAFKSWRDDYHREASTTMTVTAKPSVD